MQSVLRIQDTTYHPTYFAQQKINKLSNIAWTQETITCYGKLNWDKVWDNFLFMKNSHS